MLISATTDFKINHHRLLHETSLLKAKQTLSDIEEEMLSTDNSMCMIPVMASGEVTKKPLAWWQMKGCYRDSPDFRYYFVIEPLGGDACSIITNNNYNQIVTANYYRITLFVIFNKLTNSKLILQSTLAKSSTDHLLCAGKLHKVMPGRQMIREW